MDPPTTQEIRAQHFGKGLGFAMCREIYNLTKLTFSQIQGIHKRLAHLQKLTRNLFLTLHGHNVHRQQRQLSKFLMRYQQFASHTYCGVAGPVSKMASQQEKAFCVLRFDVSRSVITVQCEFRARFRKDAQLHGASFLNRAP